MTPRFLARLGSGVLLGLASLAALAVFCWPFLTAALLPGALPDTVQAGVLFLAAAIAIVLAAAVVLTLFDGASGAMFIAMLGTLTAVGMILRFLGAGFGGIETVLILLILSGRVFGPRFGFLLGACVMVGSALIWGGVGPWLPFQVFASGWIGAGAALLPASRARRRARGEERGREPGTGAWAELAMLAAYGIASAYAFGLLMNVWFWPFAVGTGTGISYDAALGVGENLRRFFAYSLVTSTLTWDTVRAITTVLGVLLIGRPVLAALRRSPLARSRRRSTSPRDDGTRRHPSTAQDAAAAPPRFPRRCAPGGEAP